MGTEVPGVGKWSLKKLVAVAISSHLEARIKEPVPLECSVSGSAVCVVCAPLFQ